MPPKFQSTFIPKGPVSSDFNISQDRSNSGPRDIVSLVVNIFFAFSVILALGVFAYKFYLGYRIGQMGVELETARATLAPETVTELVRLNDRIVSTQELLEQHRVVSPIFDFLEVSTPRTVRYSDFIFASGEKGLGLDIRGEARSYTALALLSQILNKNESFKDTVFSDLRLDERGNVVFSIKTHIGDDIVSYKKAVEREGAISVPPPASVVSTTTPVSGSTSTSSSPTN